MLIANINTKQVNDIINTLNFYRIGAKKRVDEALAIGALLIESDAKLLSPVDTGLNRSSIAMIRESYMKYKVSANTNYAVHLEFGTVKMAARPFMFPAYLMHRDNIIAAIKVAMKYKK